MTKEETFAYIKAYLDGDTAVGNIIPLRSVLESAIKYLEPSVPSNIDEAAEKCKESLHITETHKEIDLSFIDKSIAEVRVRDLVKAAMRAAFDEGKRNGAEWMAGQGVTREVEVKEDAGGYPYIDKHFELYDYDKDEPLFKAGGKVVVQIRKK